MAMVDAGLSEDEQLARALALSLEEARACGMETEDDCGAGFMAEHVPGEHAPRPPQPPASSPVSSVGGCAGSQGSQGSWHGEEDMHCRQGQQAVSGMHKPKASHMQQDLPPGFGGRGGMAPGLTPHMQHPAQGREGGADVMAAHTVSVLAGGNRPPGAAPAYQEFEAQGAMFGSEDDAIQAAINASLGITEAAAEDKGDFVYTVMRSNACAQQARAGGAGTASDEEDEDIQAAIKASLGVSTLEPIGTGPQPRATQPSGAAARPAGTKHPRDVAVAAGAGGMVGGVAGGAAGVHQLASPLKRSRLGEGGAVQPSSGPKDHQHEVDWNALYAAGAAQSYCPEAYAKFESLEAVNGDNWLQEAVAAVAATEYPDQTEADPDEVAAPTDPAQTDQQEPYIQADRDPADAAALNNQWADGGAAGGPCGPDLRVLKAQVLAGAKVIDNRTSLEPNLRDWFSEGPADFLRSEAAAPAAGPAAANLGRHSPTQIAPGDHTTPSQPPVVPSKQAGTSLPPHARAQQPGVTHAWTDMRGCAVRARPYQAFERVWWRRLVDGVWHTDAATVFSVDREDTLTPETATYTLELGPGAACRYAEASGAELHLSFSNDARVLVRRPGPPPPPHTPGATVAVGEGAAAAAGHSSGVAADVGQSAVAMAEDKGPQVVGTGASLLEGEAVAAAAASTATAAGVTASGGAHAAGGLAPPNAFPPVHHSCQAAQAIAVPSSSTPAAAAEPAAGTPDHPTTQDSSCCHYELASVLSIYLAQDGVATAWVQLQGCLLEQVAVGQLEPVWQLGGSSGLSAAHQGTDAAGYSQQAGVAGDVLGAAANDVLGVVGLDGSNAAVGALLGPAVGDEAMSAQVMDSARPHPLPPPPGMLQARAATAAEEMEMEAGGCLSARQLAYLLKQDLNWEVPVGELPAGCSTEDE